MNIVLFTVVASVVSALVSYGISSWFWNTDYSRTNHNGDGGGPLGGVWCTLGGATLSLMLLLNYGRFVVPNTEHFGWVLGLVCIPSVIAGFVPLFRRKK